MLVNTSANLPAHIQLYYELKLLETLEPRLTLASLGEKGRIPGGQGPTIRWTRLGKVSSSTSPLSPGVNPSSIAVTSVNIDSTLLQYGQYTKFSDELEFHAISPVIRDYAVRFGFSASETIEDLTVAELDVEAAIQRVNDRANDNAIVAGDDLDHRELIEAKISQKLDRIGPHRSGSYVVVLHPSAEFDLQADQQVGAWSDVNKQSEGRKDIMNAMMGKLYGMPLLVSDKMTNFDNTQPVQVNRSYVIGSEGFGTPGRRGRPIIRMIVKSASSGGVANPLEMFSTLGYKIEGYAVKYLDSGSKRVIQILHTSEIT